MESQYSGQAGRRAAEELTGEEHSEVCRKAWRPSCFLQQPKEEREEACFLKRFCEKLDSSLSPDFTSFPPNPPDSTPTLHIDLRIPAVWFLSLEVHQNPRSVFILLFFYELKT